MGARDRIAKILAGKAGGPTPTGIHAYHSSPHDFDRFENKLLTGEGANVYGAGTYLAENPAVSGQGGQYWKQFLPRFEGAERFAVDRLKGNAFDRAAALKVADDEATYWKNTLAGLSPDDKGRDYVARMAANQQKALELLQSGAPVGPRTYEVNFRAKPEELLDWDKPLAGQSGHVQEGIARRYYNQYEPRQSGETMYRDMARRAQMLTDKPKEYVSEQLQRGGIPGIRYLDEGSRPRGGNDRSILQNQLKATESLHATTPTDYTTKEIARLQGLIERMPAPTHNYVAFDPSRLDIMAKYGVAGGVPLGAGAMSGTFDPATYEARQ